MTEEEYKVVAEQMSESRAEIDRLKADDVRVHGENIRLCVLITELCDALELPIEEHTEETDAALIQRAREATR